MKVLLPVALVITMAASPAYAECTPPTLNFTIPDGSKASKDEMLAASHAIKDSNASVLAYGDCLKTEQDAKIAAGGDQMKDEQKLKIANEYITRNNAVVEKLQKLADQFNIELRAYKAKQPPQN